MKKILKDKSGMALPLAIACILVASMLVVGLITYSSGSVLQFSNVKRMKQSEYLARTGIEATVRAYSELDDALKPIKANDSIVTQTIYLLTDKNGKEQYSLKKDASAKGEVKVSVTKVKKKFTTADETEKEFDAVEFVSTAVVDGNTSTAKASIVQTMDGYDNKWYNENGEIAYKEGGKVTYDFIGNVILSAPPKGTDSPHVNLSLGNNENAAFIGNIVDTQMPINLSSASSSSPITTMAMMGKDLIFEKNITLSIRRSGFSSKGQNLGTLLISVPSNMCYTDPVTKEKVGKVYFLGDVTLAITTGLFPHTERVKLFSAGDVCYFKVKPSGQEPINVDPEIYAIDLVQYYLSTHKNSTNDILFDNIYANNGKKANAADDMRKIDPQKNKNDKFADLIPPNPDSSIYLVWE